MDILGELQTQWAADPLCMTAHNQLTTTKCTCTLQLVRLGNIRLGRVQIVLSVGTGRSQSSPCTYTAGACIMSHHMAKQRLLKLTALKGDVSI